jgi:hypothetical protein
MPDTISSNQIAALYDDKVNSLIDVDGSDESVLYLSAVGVPNEFL